MNIIIGFSNFSFDVQSFSSFKGIQDQFDKFKLIKSQLNQKGVFSYLAYDILEDQYYGQSLVQQFANFSFGKDKLVIAAFKMRLEREYYVGFNRQYSGSTLKDLSRSPSESNQVCYTLYAPNGFNSTEYTSIKNITEFSSYYEDILGRYPISIKSYYERATSHFTNIIYHDDCEMTLSRVHDGFCNYSIAITQCLRALNDSSPFTDRNFIQLTRSIGSKAGYDCTSQGHPGDNFKFRFEYNGEIYPSLNCHYHLKPSKRNNEGDTRHYHKRIYFGFIQIDSSQYKIAVAAIGPHISPNNTEDRYASEN